MGAGAVSELPPGFELDAAPSGGYDIRVRPVGSRSSNSAGLPEGFELDGPSLMDRAVDVAKGAGNALEAGVARGVAGLGSLPRHLPELIGRGTHAAANFIERKLGVPESAPLPTGIEGTTAEKILQQLPSYDDLMKEIREKHQGSAPEYKPRNKLEEYIQTVGEFAVGGGAGAANRLRAVANVAVPAVTSETAGQLTKGTAYEGAARLAGALVGAGGAALAQRPGTAARAIQQQLPEGVTPQMVDQAEALMQAAAQRGIDLAWPEALSQVAGRPILTDAMRHLEGAHQSKPVMDEFFAGRPQQVEQAVRAEADAISPVNRAPSNIGPAVGGEAEGIVTQVRAAINRATRPMYDAAGQHLVPQNVHAAMMADPLFAETVAAIRNDPARNAVVRAASDRSVRMYDAVAKELEQRSRNAAQPLNPQANQTIAAVTGELGGDIKNVAIAAERASTGGPSAYEAALATQARLRRQYLEPLLNGPLGRLAGRDTTTKNAIDTLFPKQPLANSEQEIGDAVRALANRNPRAASDLVRAHVEGTFNEAAKDLQTGANQAGGAKFRTQLIGNAQQRLNLQHAVEALPNGQQRWAGFNRLLDVLEATGTRQNVGSKTAYNAELLKAQSAGGVVADTAKATANPFQGFQKLVDRYEKYKLGSNLRELAEILTDPGSGDLLRSIARHPPNSQQARAIAVRLLAYGQGSRPVPPVNSSGNNPRN